MNFPTDYSKTSPIVNTEEQSPSDTEQGAEVRDESLEESLRRLRSRQLMMEAVYYSPSAESFFTSTPQTQQTTVENETSPDEEDEKDEDSSEFEAELADDEPDFDFEEAFDDLRQEIRRLGRELFKTNRTAESNQESFGEALAEIRQLSAIVAQIPQQSAEAIAEARFEAKAALCRDLLRLADSAEAGLTAADELVARLEQQTRQSATGLVFRFQQVRQLRESLVGSVSAIKQWRDGQRLLVERVQAILTAAGARPVEVLGRNFDPTLHRAVSAESRRDVSPGTIIGEELRGYTLEGRILRYAEVIVAKHE
jgi:molecular chaperone GrpE